MTKFKVCMLGGFCVGKTSLVSRYVSSMFSETYLTTVGVKVDKKVVGTASDTVMLMIWDIYGEDAVQSIALSYLRGMSGYLLVADGTRPETLAVAAQVRARVETAFGALPSMLLVNKCDRQEDWRVTPEELDPWRIWNVPVLETSALSGVGVEDAFLALAGRLGGGRS